MGIAIIIIIILVLLVFIGSYAFLVVDSQNQQKEGCVPTGTATKYGIPTSYECPYNSP